jgi:integrase
MYIYRLYDKNKKILYVGKTINNINSRIRSHFTNHKGYKRLNQLWRRKIKYFDYTIVENEAELGIYEIYLINKLKPEYNLKDKWKGSINFRLPKLQFEDMETAESVAGTYRKNKKIMENKYYELKRKKEEIKNKIIDVKLNQDYIEQGYKKMELIKSTIHRKRDELIFSLMYFYGLKLSEVRNLKSENIDLKNKTIKIDDRVFKLNKIIVDLLNFFNKKRGFLFISQHNNVISSRTIQSMLREYLDSSPSEIRKDFRKNIINENKKLLLGLSDKAYYSGGNRKISY